MSRPPQSPWPHRLLALGASTALSIGLGWAAYRWLGPGPAESLAFVEIKPSEALDYMKPPDPDAPWADYEYYLDIDTVRRLFDLGRKNDLRVYDPWFGFISAPNRDLLKHWPEYPGDAYRSRTNSAGYADRELDTEADVRILAAGDSHTFGLCDLERTWPNRLEQYLQEAWPERRVEVLNTGQGGHSLYQYFGALEKHLEWEPQAFIPLIFAGNDFSETLGMAGIYREAAPRGVGYELTEKRTWARQNLSATAMGQCYNSILSFVAQPKSIDTAVDLSLSLVEKMQDVCEQNGIMFALAVAPTPCCVPWKTPPPAFAEIEAYFEFPEDACSVHREIVDRFVAGARELGVTTLDLRQAVVEGNKAYFWRQDQHLNTRGLKLIARELLPVVLAWGRDELGLEAAATTPGDESR